MGEEWGWDLAAIKVGDECSRGLCRGAVEKWLKTQTGINRMCPQPFCVHWGAWRKRRCRLWASITGWGLPSRTELPTAGRLSSSSAALEPSGIRETLSLRWAHLQNGGDNNFLHYSVRVLTQSWGSREVIYNKENTNEGIVGRTKLYIMPGGRSNKFLLGLY